MKITKNILKQLIKEALEEARREAEDIRGLTSDYAHDPEGRIKWSKTDRPEHMVSRDAPGDYTPPAATMSHAGREDTARRADSAAYNLGFEAGQKGLSVNDPEAGYMSLGGGDQFELRRDWEQGYALGVSVRSDVKAGTVPGKGARSLEVPFLQSQKTGPEGDKPSGLGPDLYREGIIRKLTKNTLKQLVREEFGALVREQRNPRKVPIDPRNKPTQGQTAGEEEDTEASWTAASESDPYGMDSDSPWGAGPLRKPMTPHASQARKTMRDIERNTARAAATDVASIKRPGESTKGHLRRRAEELGVPENIQADLLANNWDVANKALRAHYNALSDAGETGAKHLYALHALIQKTGKLVRKTATRMKRVRTR